VLERFWMNGAPEKIIFGNPCQDCNTTGD